MAGLGQVSWGALNLFRRREQSRPKESDGYRQYVQTTAIYRAQTR
jgi:hypothetical protein